MKLEITSIVASLMGSDYSDTDRAYDDAEEAGEGAKSRSAGVPPSAYSSWDPNDPEERMARAESILYPRKRIALRFGSAR